MPIARVCDIEIYYEVGGHGPAPAENFGYRRRPAAAAPVIVEALTASPNEQKVMPPAQPGAVSPADGAGDTAMRSA